MSDILLVRINCPDEETALSIGEALVSERLAACVNIEGPITSIYRWEGAIERDEEYVLVAKAPADNWVAIEARVGALHPFEAPAILAIPCVRANRRYAEWLKAETQT